MRGISRRLFIQTSTAGLLMTMHRPLLGESSVSGRLAAESQDPCFMSANTLAAAIRAKTISPVEVIDALYARIHKLNPRINAFCTLTEEQARQNAKDAEAAVMRRDRLGPLHGVPVSIKDLFLTRGVRTMYGSHIRENFVPDEDAPAVAKLREAGAILIGKTTTPEFAFKAVTDSPVTGVSRNPWNLDKTCGGSSGGAAAAVASGLGPLAIGSDGAGSVRIPAAFNGVFGLKPTLGRVAYYPSSPVPFLVHAGPITRTVQDAALLLNVIAGPDERDLLSLPADGADYLASSQAGIRGLRVAWSPNLGYAKVNAEVARITEAAAKIFENSLGCTVEAVEPGFEDPATSFSVLWMTSYALRLRSLLPEWQGSMDPELVKLVASADNLRPTEYAEAVASRSAFWDKTRKFFDRFDVLLTPTSPVPPFAVGRNAPEDASGAGGKSLYFLNWLLLTYPWNLTGQPAASVPCGFTPDGLPVGMQIIGRRFADAVVIRAAAAYEQAQPWTSKQPPS